MIVLRDFRNLIFDVHLGVEPKLGVVKTPQIVPFVHRGFPYKPSILGYHYFWKHPFQQQWSPKFCSYLAYVDLLAGQPLKCQFPGKFLLTPNRNPANTVGTILLISLC